MAGIFPLLSILSACTNKAVVSKIKTEYHLAKHIYNGQEVGHDETIDTFYYKDDGYSYDSTKILSEVRTGNMIETKRTDGSGKLISTSITFLNEKELADSVIYIDDKLGTYTHKYIYNDAGKVVEDRNYPSKGPKAVWKYKLEGGNLVQEEMSHQPSFDTSYMPNPQTGKEEQVIMIFEDIIAHNEFYPDKTNMPTAENFGYKYDTSPNRLSKNLKKMSVQLNTKGDTVDVFTFAYRFDDKGRVISVAQHSRSGEVYDSTAYTYY
jgi:hypothetical protein